MEKIKELKIKTKDEGYCWEAISSCGEFSAKRHTEKEAVDAVVLKVLYSSCDRPKVKVNNKNWLM